MSQKLVLEEFFNQLSLAQTSVLMLDYDGTLAPFQMERDKAYPYPGVLPLLEKIVHSGKTRIVIITGRPIQEVQTLLAPLSSIEIWGAHGLDHLHADGTREHYKIDPELTALLNEGERFLQSNGWSNHAEVKPGGVAVHWRGLPEQKIEEIRSSTLNSWATLAEHPDIKLLRFEGGLELRIAHPDKGDAITAVLQNVGANIPAAFLGDDLTDEDGFRRLSQCGLSVLVRNEYRPTEAKVWLKPPVELLDFFKQWINKPL